MATKKELELRVEQTEGGEKQNTQINGTRKLVLMSIGIFALAKDEIENLIDRLIERGEIAEQDGRKRMQEVMDKRQQRSSKVNKVDSSRLESVMNHTHIASKADINTLNKKITQLSDQINNLNNP